MVIKVVEASTAYDFWCHYNEDQCDDPSLVGDYHGTIVNITWMVWAKNVSEGPSGDLTAVLLQLGEPLSS